MDHVALKEELSLRLVANLGVGAHELIQRRFRFEDGLDDWICKLVDFTEHVLVGLSLLGPCGDVDVGDVG